MSLNSLDALWAAVVLKCWGSRSPSPPQWVAGNAVLLQLQHPGGADHAGPHHHVHRGRRALLLRPHQGKSHDTVEPEAHHRYRYRQHWNSFMGYDYAMACILDFWICLSLLTYIQFVII